MIRIRSGCIPIVLLGLVLGGCGGGGGGLVTTANDGDGGAAPVTNNLAVTGVTVVSADPQVGYPLELNVTITALEETPDVGVAIYAAFKEDVDRNDDGPVRQFLLGASSIEGTALGTINHPVKITVPADVSPAGEYVLIAAVDDGGFIEETVESDNFAQSTIVLREKGEPVNIFIENASLDSTAIMLDRHLDEPRGADEEYNADVSATLRLGVEGTDEPVAVEVFAKLRFTRTDNNTVFDVPLYLWDSGDLNDPNDLGHYTNAYGVDPEYQCFVLFEPCPDNTKPELIEWLPLGDIAPQLTNGDAQDFAYRDVDRRSVHLDMYLPGNIGDELQKILDSLCPTCQAAGAPQFPPPDLSNAMILQLQNFFFTVTREQYDAGLVTACVVFDVRPVDPLVNDLSAEDSQLCVDADVIAPPEPPPPPPGNQVAPALYSSGYRTRWDSEYFGFSLLFNAQATADRNGLIASGSGSVPVRAFGFNSEFLGVTARAQILPAYDGAPGNQTPGFDLELRFAGVTVFEEHTKEPSITLGCNGIDEVCKFSKELAGGSQTFTKFLYPITISGKVTGNIGVDYAITLSPTSLTLTCEPYINMEGSAEVELGLLFFDVGIAGSMTLVENRFKIREAATLEVFDDGLGGGDVDIVLVPQLSVINELTGADGTLSAFLQYSELVWCSGDWWNPGYPCFRTTRITADVVSWRGFKRADRLLEKSVPIRLVSFGDQFAYYEVED